MWRASCLAIVVACLWPAVARAVDPAVAAAEQQRIEAMAKVTPSVVAIFAPGGQGGGSGVLITPDGYTLTNFHVTNGSGQFMKCGLADGVLYDAVLVGLDPTGDVAMIKLLGRDDFPHATLSDSDNVKVGDWAFAMGNPFLLATDFQPTATYGIISGVHRYQYPAGTILEYTDCLQTDVSINPGNSGGPLFNAQGDLIGINGRGSFEKRGRVNSGAGYAISINQIKHFMDHLRGGRIVDHATLGATVATRDDGAVIVTSILDKSEAYRRGLRQDDEIVSFGNRPMRSVNQFKNVLGIFPKGWRLPLVYRRDGVKHETMVRLRGLHRQSELTGDDEPKPKPAPKRQRKPGEPEPKPGEAPKPSPHPPAAKPPEHLAKLSIERRGFSNYYFNLLERDRTLKPLAALGDFSKDTGLWSMTGTLSVVPLPTVAKVAVDDEPEDDALVRARLTREQLVAAEGANKGPLAIEIKAAEKGVGLTFAAKDIDPYFQGLDGDDIGDEPPGTGGLLLALHHFRMFLAEPKKFTEFYYLGSEPFEGTGERVDVLVAELGGAQSWWFVSRGKGTLLGFDLYRTEDVDACEIRFGAWGDFAGKKLPTQWQVRYGGQDVGKLALTGWTFTPPKVKEAVKPENKVEEKK